MIFEKEKRKKYNGLEKKENTILTLILCMNVEKNE